MSDEPQLKVSSTNVEATVTPLALGKRVKDLRLAQNLTLEQASQLTGLARSTLSKIENEQISPTFAAVTKLAQGLGIELPQLFTAPKKESLKPAPSVGRRDITKAGQGKFHPTPTYEHELLCTQLSNKKMVPFKTSVHARDWNDYTDWVRHEGEEFLYVLNGSIILYTEFYEPIELHAGDSAYYDCEMGHALVSISENDAEVLWVTA